MKLKIYSLEASTSTTVPVDTENGHEPETQVPASVRNYSEI